VPLLEVLATVNRHSGFLDEFQRSTWKINPSGYIDTKLIEENWDDFLRLIVTIKLNPLLIEDLAKIL